MILLAGGDGPAGGLRGRLCHRRCRDLALAESVITADVRVDDLQREIEERAIGLLARQQPVATDLRTVVPVIAW